MLMECFTFWVEIHKTSNRIQRSDLRIYERINIYERQL